MINKCKLREGMMFLLKIDKHLFRENLIILLKCSI